MNKKEDKFSLLDYLPKNIIAGKKFNEYDLSIGMNYSDVFLLSYKSSKNRKYSLIIPRYLYKNIESFEVL